MATWSQLAKWAIKKVLKVSFYTVQTKGVVLAEETKKQHKKNKKKN